MKKLMVVFMAMVLGLVLVLSGVAMAGNSTTVNVSANVMGTCKFSSGSTPELNFGDLDPASNSDVTKNTTVQFWCTRGVTTESFTANYGKHGVGSQRNMKLTTGADLIPYTLTLTPDGSTNQGPGSPRTLTISGTILNTDYISKAAGSYSDTVTLEINL